MGKIQIKFFFGLLFLAQGFAFAGPLRVRALATFRHWSHAGKRVIFKGHITLSERDETRGTLELSVTPSQDHAFTDFMYEKLRLSDSQKAVGHLIAKSYRSRDSGPYLNFPLHDIRLPKLARMVRLKGSVDHYFSENLILGRKVTTGYDVYNHVEVPFDREGPTIYLDMDLNARSFGIDVLFNEYSITWNNDAGATKTLSRIPLESLAWVTRRKISRGEMYLLHLSDGDVHLPIPVRVRSAGGAKVVVSTGTSMITRGKVHRLLVDRRALFSAPAETLEAASRYYYGLAEANHAAIEFALSKVSLAPFPNSNDYVRELLGVFDCEYSLISVD